MSNSNSILVFLGPDGVGKSTTIEYLSNDIKQSKNVKVFHFRPNFVPGLGQIKKLFGRNHNDTFIEITPQRTKVTLPSEIVRFFIIFLDLSIYKILLILYYRNTLFIFDRYISDLFVDPLRYRITSKVLIKVLIWGSPAVDLNIVMVDTFDNILSRCVENEPMILKNLLNDYTTLSLKDPKIIYELSGSIAVDHDRLRKTVAQLLKN